MDNRATSRRRVLKAGRISFDRVLTMDCAIRNVSRTGACLEVSSPVGIPDRSTLVVKSENMKPPCHVAWAIGTAARRPGLTSPHRGARKKATPVPNNPANQYQRKARGYLAKATETSDVDRRQELLRLCEQELAQAVEHRGSPKEITSWPTRPDRRKKPR